MSSDLLKILKKSFFCKKISVVRKNILLLGENFSGGMFMTFLRGLLYPFSLIYGVVTYIRNKLFDWQILPSKSFDVPVIAIGNLSVGGTGKTPHTEYLIRMLQAHDYKVAVVSRGYKRKTKGFVPATENSTAQEIGDEPFQMKKKFPSLIVAVDEKRARGIEKLLELYPDIDVVLLDDAFQHRWVKAGFYILITNYFKPFNKDFLLPTGNLRECRSGARRADMLIVSKSPVVLSPIVRKEFVQHINQFHSNKILFSKVRHKKIKAFPGLDIPTNIDRVKNIIVFTGIADPYLLETYLKKYCDYLDTIHFPDHFDYSLNDIDLIKERFIRHYSKNKILVTTEKDVGRLLKKEIVESIKELPLYYVPIEIEFQGDDKEHFENKILTYVEKNKRNSQLHTAGDTGRS